MFRYLVLCRVYPESGMDLAKSNKVLNVLEKSLISMSEGSSGLEQTLSNDVLEAIHKYREKSEGYILEVVPIVSENKISDPEKEMMPDIRKEYPEAELVRYVRIPADNSSSELEDNLIGYLFLILLFFCISLQCLVLYYPKP